MGRPFDWKRLHNFVEYGHWNIPILEDTLAQLLEAAPGRLWYGYRIRAWTHKPVERTSWAQMRTMSLLRLLQFRLEALGEKSWWYRPPWNERKVRPSILDVERLLRSHREEMLAGLSAWLGSEGESEGAEGRERAVD